MSSQAETQTQDALDAFTAALLAGEDSDNLKEQSDLPADELAGFAGIIESLRGALAPVEPSADFAEALRAELLGERQGMVKRVRQMPARVHFAAILALLAGCLLVVMRRLIGSDAPQEMHEEAVATPL